MTPQHQHAWDTTVVHMTSHDLVILATDIATNLINQLAPQLGSPVVRYPNQMLLEEVIKELQSRV